MNARFGLSIVALCIAGMLAGCASVTQGTQFQPPTGWSGTPAIMGRFQMWFKAGTDKSNGQFLMLVKTNASDKSMNFNEIESSTRTKDVKVVRQGPTRFCGTQPGEQYVAAGTDNKGRKMSVEMTDAVIGTDKYTAVYVRPAALAPDTQAETAIHSLCPIAK